MKDKSPITDSDKIVESNINKNLIIVIIAILVLTPIAIFTTLNKKDSPKSSNEATVIENKKNSDIDSSGQTSVKTPENGQKKADAIHNSYCDMDLTPTINYLKDYIYTSAVTDGCAIISTENPEYISKKTTEAYNKAVVMKDKWLKQYSDKVDTASMVNFVFGQYTILNKNGNTLGWVITLSYHIGLNGAQYYLNTNDEWVLIDK